MGRGRRRQILIALGLVMLMGIAVYLRLWTIDYRISSSETELLRKQFDLANREAMDESAEWRQRFDAEVEKTSTCYKDLSEIKESLRHKAGDSVGLKKKLEILQKVKCCITSFSYVMINHLFLSWFCLVLLLIQKHFNSFTLSQQENMDLLERVESLKQELESEKLKCSMRQI
ncbi:Hypothetical predicted protein [Olea europaea subsp. europaea]|uniref:Uncharacterized protein n=1 Tax=Olea europaea subsp. europaea TaxID=158383 RepID=A0A8S0PLR0_OLEEU|nr:Hypothetical predicted protein [Olea europaea subsp. europaea]